MDYFDLGPFSRTITTHSPDAQVWFDRGLNWVYVYNHMEDVVGCIILSQHSIGDPT